MHGFQLLAAVVSPIPLAIATPIRVIQAALLSQMIRAPMDHPQKFHARDAGSRPFELSALARWLRRARLAQSICWLWGAAPRAR